MQYCLSSTRMMSTLATTAFVLFLTHGPLAAGNTVVSIDLYYESLCGDSVRFVKNQLVPSYDSLKDHLKVNFIPYGKATNVYIGNLAPSYVGCNPKMTVCRKQHRRDVETGRWSFMCQHGPAECKGNGAQACALNAIENNEKAEDRQKLSVELVGCVMASTNPSTAVTRCGQTVGLSTVTKQRITECEGSTLADDLLAAHGDKTYSLEPALSFVPTVVFNGVYSAENQSAALRNLKSLVCGMIPQNERPASCPTS